MERFGVKNVMELSEFIEKIAESKIRNGTDVFTGGVPRVNGVFASFPQINIGKRLGAKVNYRVLKKWIDIAIPESKIAIEYDGSGHKLSVAYGNKTMSEFLAQEEIFMNRLLDSEWRLIRIVNEKDLPLDYELIDRVVKYFANSDEKYLKITIS